MLEINLLAKILEKQTKKKQKIKTKNVEMSQSLLIVTLLSYVGVIARIKSRKLSVKRQKGLILPSNI